MKTNHASMTEKHNHIPIIFITTAVLLLIPLAATRFSADVHWAASDFLIAGLLLLVTGLAGDTILTKVHSNKRKLLALGTVLLAFMYIWTELAVGIFTKWGS